MTIISRDEAKAAGLKRFFTGIACKGGHIAERFVSSKICLECQRARIRASRSENPAKWSIYNRTARANKKAKDPTYYALTFKAWANSSEEIKETLRKRCRKYAKRNHAQRIKYNKAWRHRNPELACAHSKKWGAKNRDKQLAACRRRQTAQMRRLPKWADLEAIEAFYIEARRLTKKTGIEHQVDHIIPLRGDSVSGLHVHQNLQILVATENQRKSNHWVFA